MRTRVMWLVMPTVLLGLAACKKEEPKAPEIAGEAPAVVAPAAETPTAPEPAPAPAVPALSADERAAKLGFAKFLPKDTEALISVHNGARVADRIRASQLWALVETEMDAEAGADMEPEMPEVEGEVEGEMEIEPPVEPAEPPADAAVLEEETPVIEPEEAGGEDPFGPATLLGREVTIALGKTAGEQGAHLLTLSSRQYYFQMRSFAKALVSAAKSGELSSIGDAFIESSGPELFTELLSDPQSGTALLERLKMPPLYIAMKVDEAQREIAAQEIASSMPMIMGIMGETVSPVEVEKGGSKFAGFQVLGSKLAEQLEAKRESMEENIAPEVLDKLLAIVAKQNLVILSGTVGDYVVLFLGASTDDLSIAATPGDSLLATDAIAFGDAYASKEIAAVLYGEKAAMKTLSEGAGGLADMANGLRDGLAGGDGLGDTRDLEALLQLVAEREAALLKLQTSDATGTIAFLEEGLKVESYGGTDTGLIDYKTPAKLAHLGNSPDTVLFANMTADAAYDKLAREYFESLFETAYAMTLKVSELPMESGDLAQFKEMTKLFDGKFRSDLVMFWEALSVEMADGLGLESAWVMDLKGSVPTVPGVPKPVLEKGRFPRFSMIAPVTDRAKLKASWEKINASSTSLLAKVSEMTGSEIPMQKPISSEKDGYTTWFFPLPFFNDDFLPSVTVGDKWFAASSSKNQALDLVSKASSGGETRNGLFISVNLKNLHAYAAESLKLVEENPAEILDGKFTEEMEDIRKVVKATENLDSFMFHARREGSQLRSSFHFKTR